jgi:hypothetical protein
MRMTQKKKKREEKGENAHELITRQHGLIE